VSNDYVVTFNLDPTVFSDRYSMRREVERITGAIAARIEDGETQGTGKDSNGNTCATWKVDK
jgi:hypothetical protein